jgi:integrase
MARGKKLTNVFTEKKTGTKYVRKSYTLNGERRQVWRRLEEGDDPAQVLRDLENELAEHGPQLLIDSRTPLQDYLDQWLEITKANRGEKAKSSYEGLIRLYIKPALGKIELGKVSKMEVQRLYSNMSERGLRSRTVRYTHAVLNAALNQAVEWNKLKKNPVKGAPLPQKDTAEMQPLDEKELKVFRAEYSKDKHALLYELALYTGMRPSECLGLQWKHIDFDKGILRVRQTVHYNRKGGGWYFGPTKNEASKRTYPLDEELSDALRRHKFVQWQYIQERVEQKKPYEQNYLVFASEVGTPLSIRNFERDSFKPLLKRAALPDIRLYDLRHTCATHQILHGTDIKTLSEWLGHSNPSETLKTYAHVLASMKTQASKNILQALRG